MSVCVVLLQHPSRVWLLRGNHEDRPMNFIYGLYAECLSKFGAGDGETLWRRSNSLFDFLPLAAAVPAAGVLLLHGGIGDSIQRIQQLKDLPKPITVPQRVGKETLSVSNCLLPSPRSCCLCLETACCCCCCEETAPACCCSGDSCCCCS